MTMKESAQPGIRTTNLLQPSPSANTPLPFWRLRLDHSGYAPTHVMVESRPLRTNRRGHLTQWGRKRVNTSGMISEEGQHLGDRVLAVPFCDQPTEGHHLGDEGRLRPPGGSV